MSRLTILNVSIWLLISSFSTAHTSDGIVWPVDAKPAVTSSFGEFRPGHFHSGLDLKVYGRIGDPCRAIEAGWVSRVKVSPAGYGRALYMRMADGRTAVYAHLAGFSKEITKIIQSEQELKQDFAVEMYFNEKEAVHFKKGDIVGYAGRSGTRHPHLHFEIRDSAERPLNVLTQGFDISDNIPPVPVALAIEPLDGYSTVELDCQPRLFSQLVKRNNGVWGPRDPVGVSGRIGISIDSYDKADAAENLLAVHNVKMYVNDQLRWETTFDKFSFSQTGLIETERNYRLYRRGKGVFHRLFHVAGNDLSLCAGDGIIDAGSENEFPLEVKIILSDYNKNSTTIKLSLVPDGEPDDDRLVTGSPMISHNGWGNPENDKIALTFFDNYIRFACSPGIDRLVLDGELDVAFETLDIGGQKTAIWIPPLDFDGQVTINALDRIGRLIEAHDMNIYRILPAESYEIPSTDGLLHAEIPEGAVYDTTLMRIIPEPSYIIPGEIESVYRIEPMDQPLDKRIFIKLKRDSPMTDSSRWGVYYLDKRSGWTFLGNSIEGEYLSGPALSWETFGMVQDMDLPELKIHKPIQNKSYRSQTFSFSATVRDETSGLTASGLQVVIDDRIVPAEYEPQRKKLSYKPFKALEPGAHSLKVTVSDRVGNQVVRSVKFDILP